MNASNVNSNQCCICLSYRDDQRSLASVDLACGHAFGRTCMTCRELVRRHCPLCEESLPAGSLPDRQGVIRRPVDFASVRVLFGLSVACGFFSHKMGRFATNTCSACVGGIAGSIHCRLSEQHSRSVDPGRNGVLDLRCINPEEIAVILVVVVVGSVMGALLSQISS